MDWQKLFLSADGRIGRERFWIGWGIVFAANIVLSVLVFLHLLIHIFSCYVLICLFTKRLHDMGRSGWLQLIPIIAGVMSFGFAIVLFGWTILSAITGGRFPYSDYESAFGMLGAFEVLLMVIAVFGLINLVFLVWIGATPGQEGANRYGPDPRAEIGEEVF